MFGNLTQLRRLWLQNNMLSGESPVELGNLTALTQVFLGGTNTLSGCLPEPWQALELLRDDLDTLELDFCAVSEADSG